MPVILGLKCNLESTLASRLGSAHHLGLLRSRQATEFLRARGLAQVSNLAGGIDAYAREIDPSLAIY